MLIPGRFWPLKKLENIKKEKWPAPEVSVNVNLTELGNLGLTDREEDEIAAFLKTLSDGYR